MNRLVDGPDPEGAPYFVTAQLVGPDGTLELSIGDVELLLIALDGEIETLETELETIGPDAELSELRTDLDGLREDVLEIVRRPVG